MPCEGKPYLVVVFGDTGSAEGVVVSRTARPYRKRIRICGVGGLRDRRNRRDWRAQNMPLLRNAGLVPQREYWEEAAHFPTPLIEAGWVR